MKRAAAIEQQRPRLSFSVKRQRAEEVDASPLTDVTESRATPSTVRGMFEEAMAAEEMAPVVNFYGGTDGHHSRGSVAKSPSEEDPARLLGTESDGDEVDETRKQKVVQQRPKYGLTYVDDQASAEQYGANQNAGTTNSRYLSSIIRTKTRRTLELETIAERNLQREMEQDASRYGDKEVFVTESYKRKLRERQQLADELDRQDARDRLNDVTQKNDLTAFHARLLNSGKASRSSFQQLPTDNKSNHKTEPNRLQAATQLPDADTKLKFEPKHTKTDNCNHTIKHNSSNHVTLSPNTELPLNIVKQPESNNVTINEPSSSPSSYIIQDHAPTLTSSSHLSNSYTEPAILDHPPANNGRKEEESISSPSVKSLPNRYFSTTTTDDIIPTHNANIAPRAGNTSLCTSTDSNTQSHKINTTTKSNPSDGAETRQTDRLSKIQAAKERYLARQNIS